MTEAFPLSLAIAILDENLKGPTATFDEMGLAAVRSAWLAVRARLDAERPAEPRDDHENLEGGGDETAQSQPVAMTPKSASVGSEPSAEWRDIESGVTLEFTARHLDATLDEGWHVHTFSVTIWRDGEPWTDGRSARGALDTLLRTIAPEAADGVRELAPELWSNEAIAKAVWTLGNVTEVHVNRPGFKVKLR